MFEAMDVFLPVLFAILSGIIAMKVLLGVREGRRSRRHPVLTVEAKIVAKRQHVSRTYPADDDSHQPIDTKYYATFEVESGDRLEFRLTAEEYAMLAEGDVGKLTFQGKRYCAFVREHHWMRRGDAEMLRAGSGG
jgi:hypothetical protein